MIYRINLRDGEREMGCAGRAAAELLELLGLRVPPADVLTEHARCWFTEHGWERLGRAAFKAQIAELDDLWGIGACAGEHLTLTIADDPEPEDIAYADEDQYVLRSSPHEKRNDAA